MASENNIPNQDSGTISPTGTPPPTDPALPTASSPAQPVTPVAVDQTNAALAAAPIQASTSPISPTTPSPKRKSKYLIVLLIVVAAGALAGGYFLGQQNKKVVYQEPPPKPINLPAQAILVKECVVGRGKQYIIPKDIPLGPVYDVNSNKVIAVEYNFKAVDLIANGSKLSDTIIPFFQQNYQVDHFTITPGAPEAGKSQDQTPINVAIFVVPNSVSSKVTCPKT
jgi:hypothetical protein